MVIERDKKINGEYDPPYKFNKKPTKEQKEAAQKIIDKYKKISAKKS